MTINYADLCNQIEQLQASEKVSRQLLGELSRSLLLYVLENEDIRPVNALLGKNDNGFVLSPVNWRIACQYFKHFVGFKSNYNEVKDCIINGGNREPLVFTGKDKKRYAKVVDSMTDWLLVDTNDIWVWSNNVKVEVKPVDYRARLISAINSAINEEKGGLSPAEVMQAMLESDIDTDTLLLAAMNTQPVDNNDLAAADKTDF